MKKGGRYTCEPFEFAIASLDEVFVFHLGIVNFQDTFAIGLLALNFTLIPQDSKLPERCTEVKPKFAFFQKQRERFAVNAVVFAQYTLRLVPKIFNAVDMILALGKRFAMVDAVMDIVK